MSGCVTDGIKVAANAYTTTYRRLLIDMHIPDGDEAFLQRYDSASIVRAAASAGVSGLMVYFQSHTGLCNWPTKSGQLHRAFRGRDVMAETLDAARRSSIAVCAYYSVNFNNWACAQHPTWSLRPAVDSLIGGGLLQRERYGICCLNNGDYFKFVAAQIEEIAGHYEVDGFFFDMVWWMSVCLCESCRDRFRREYGRDIPDTVDWLNPDWCEFQAARERWLTHFAMQLRRHVHSHRPGIPVYHNFAVGAANWTRGISFDSAIAHDFLGGDFYGGRDEQLLISRLMTNLSERRPVEFMTTVSSNLAEHERLKTQAALDAQCLAACATHAAFLAILAIDPDGGLNSAAMDRVGQMFARTQPLESFLGGTPVEDIAVYFSSDSKMNFSENGQTLAQAASGSASDYPHLHAVSGACRILQGAHLPFGVITRRQLDTLDRYRVVVLPNVLRMDDDEVAAIRRYVQSGGKVYASRLTSLTHTAGRRGTDFMLADVFGCHFEALEGGRNLYLVPAEAQSSAAIAPERALSHWIEPNERSGAVRLAAQTDARVLMTLTLPYGYPRRGTSFGNDWSSIHSFPPWQKTALPTVAENRFGGGRAIYSAADLESGSTSSHDALFLALIRSLLGPCASFGSDAHPCVWMTVFEQFSENRRVVAFTNQTAITPPLPVPRFTFELTAPPGRRFTRLVALPANDDAAFTLKTDGSLKAQVAGLNGLLMFAAEFA